MKRYIFGFLVAALCMPTAWADAPAPQAQSEDHVAQLKWLDSADADKMVQADIKKGIYHFLVFCGMTCEPLPMDNVDALQCFPGVQYFRMAGTADAITSDEDGRYQKKAGAFAVQYNLELREYLSKHGMTDCAPGEDWSSAGFDMNRQLSDNPNEKEDVDFAYDNAARRYRFAVYTKPEQRDQDTYEGLCGAAVRHYLSSPVILEIYDKKTQAPLLSIECKYGRPVPSDWKPKPGDVPKLPGFQSGG